MIEGDFYIGKHKYDCKYLHFPEKFYEGIIGRKLTRRNNDDNDIIDVRIITNGQVKILDKETYVDMINKFGKLRNFLPMVTNLIQKKIMI